MQRASAESVGKLAQAEYSHLARYLLEEYAFGGISAHQVQQLAHMAHLDGLHHPDVDKLASFGTWGKHTGNIDRDLRHYVRNVYLSDVHMPCADTYQLPLKILKGPDKGVHMMPHHYMAPHVLISFIWNSFREDVKHKLLGTTGAMAEFWAGVPPTDPRLVQLRQDHPEYSKWCVPIVIHGDGVPCTKNHSLDTLSFESLLSKRSMDKHYSSVDYIFFMSGVFTQTMVSDDRVEDTSKGVTNK